MQPSSFCRFAQLQLEEFRKIITCNIIPRQEITLSESDVLAYEVKIFIERQNSPRWVILIGIVKRQIKNNNKHE